MKNGTDCKHALWDRTATGRLHPQGNGVEHVSQGISIQW